jgi:hypothetical protein
MRANERENNGRATGMNCRTGRSIRVASRRDIPSPRAAVRVNLKARRRANEILQPIGLRESYDAAITIVLSWGAAGPHKMGMKAAAITVANMLQIDWVRKLSERKTWRLGVGLFATGPLTKDSRISTQTASIIMY